MSFFRNHNAILLKVTLCLILPSMALAQEEEKITLQFVSFPKSTSPEPVELLIGEGKTMEVKIPSNALSEPYQVPLLSKWVVGKSEIGQDEKTTFAIYGQGSALDSKNQLIILVRKGAENADGMELIAVDNQRASFGGGSYLFMNVAKIDIAGEVGDQKFTIKPNARTILKPEGEDDAKVFQTMFYFRKDNEAKPFFSSKWPVNDKARSLVFFYHDPHNQRLRFHSIRHFLID